MTNTTGYILKLLKSVFNLSSEDSTVIRSTAASEQSAPLKAGLVHPPFLQINRLSVPASAELRLKSRERQQAFSHQKFISKVDSILERNLQNTAFHVEKLSQEMGLSRVHLYRKIKEVSGASPSAYIRNYRLQRAALFLREENCSVSDAAYYTGFNDLSHFSKCFKKAFGLSPSHYQKNGEGFALKMMPADKPEIVTSPGIMRVY